MLGVTLTLYDGSTPQANLTGLQASWWDVEQPYDFTECLGSSTNITTDANGVCSINLSEISGLPIGGYGFLMIYQKQTISDDSQIFAARIQTTDIVSGDKLTYKFNQTPTAPTPFTWVRPTEWPALDTPVDGVQKIQMLIRVDDNSEASTIIAFYCAGAYTVDWGDGVTDNFADSITAEHTYAVSNTNLTTTTYGYKCAVVTVTPQSGSNLNDIHFTNTPTGRSSSYLLPITELVINSVYLNAFFGGGKLDLLQSFIIGEHSLTTYNSLFSNCFVLENVNFLRNSSANITSVSSMFSNCFVLKTIPLFDTSKVTSISSMFSGCSSLEEIPQFDFSSVSTATAMFSTCASLETISLPLLGDGVNSVNMNSMFSNCYTLSEVTFDPAQIVNNISYCFSGCRNLTVAPRIPNSSYITNMSNMFSSCIILKILPYYDTSNVTNMYGMFTTCYSLATVPFFDTSSVTDMHYMFYNCYALREIPLFNTSNVTNMYSMFYTCYSLATVPFFDTSSVTDMYYMFNGCYRIKTVPLFNTTNVTNMSGMFNNCNNLETIPSFDCSKVTDISNMFNACRSMVESPNLSTTNALKRMSYTFGNCDSLTKVNLFDTSGVTDMSHTFDHTKSLKTIPLFDTSSVTTMYFMFYFSYIKTIPLLNTSSVTNFGYMLYYTTQLRGVPALDMSSAISATTTMFADCYNLNYCGLTNIKLSLTITGSNLDSSAINTIFNNLDGTVTGQTINISGNPGSATCDTTIATNKGWTVIN